MPRLHSGTLKKAQLGPLVWLLSIQYFIVQALVARAWRKPSYSWSTNTISDLGNTSCKTYGGHLICSPLYTLMNASFIALGLTMIIGSVLIYYLKKTNSLLNVALAMMSLAGIGTMLVGFFPENRNATIHTFGASFPFLLGNISLLLFAKALKEYSIKFKIYSFVSGSLGLIALALYLSQSYLFFGSGGTERIVAYPQTIWMIVFGLIVIKNVYDKK